MKTFREHLKTQECTEISPDEYPDEMKQRKLAYGMDKMLEVFLNDNISEYFFFEENGKWIEELK